MAAHRICRTGARPSVVAPKSMPSSIKPGRRRRLRPSEAGARRGRLGEHGERGRTRASTANTANAGEHGEHGEHGERGRARRTRASTASTGEHGVPATNAWISSRIAPHRPLQNPRCDRVLGWSVVRLGAPVPSVARKRVACRSVASWRRAPTGPTQSRVTVCRCGYAMKSWSGRRPASGRPASGRPAIGRSGGRRPAIGQPAIGRASGGSATGCRSRPRRVSRASFGPGGPAR